MLDDGSVPVQQIQTMRVLSPNSAARLARELDEADPPDSPEPPLGEEDYTRLRTHVRVERDPKLANKAKAVHGFTCQACGVDMERLNGDVGREYIEPII